MLVHVHQQGIGGAAGVVGPQVGLAQADAVEGLPGPAVAAVGQGFGVGIDATERIHHARMPLDVGRRAEVVRRRAATDADGGAVGVADRFGIGCCHCVSIDGETAILAVSGARRLTLRLYPNTPAAAICAIVMTETPVNHWHNCAIIAITISRKQTENTMTGRATGGLHEQNANPVIAQWLNDTGRNWIADAERTGVIEGSNVRPDIVIREGDRMPVIVECEFGNPAIADAESRLGVTLVGEYRPFTEVIAVGIAECCKRDSEAQFRQRLDANKPIFTIRLVSRNGSAAKIWPDQPLPATPTDLAAYCEYAQVPQAVIDDHSERIARRVESAGTKLLESIRLTRNRSAPTLEALRNITGCGHDEQATRTACAIWLIAIDLQNDLARYSPNLQARNLQTTDAILAESGVLTTGRVLEQWRIIESVNYLPVVELATQSLTAGEMGSDISDVLKLLHDLSEQLNGLHAKHVYNFAGELWQRLVSDREERAAHYTKPETAELLATLAAVRFNGRTAEQIAGLNLMDAACGTGTLVGAGERALRRHYAAQGGRDSELHRKRMEEHIYAMDVNGIAGTLTAKRLTDMNVEQDYSGSKIAVITDPAGSLLLLNPNVTGVSNVLGYRNVTPTVGSGGEEGVFHVMLQGIDWSLMNPPYSKPMPGRRMATTGLRKPRAAARRRKYLMSNGLASLATDFGNLSNIRLAPDGVLSHVLPLTAARSGAWSTYRSELEKDFQDIIAIANVSSAELQSMSADTGMGEMLVIATKRNKRPKEWQPTEILCINLHTAPATLAEGYALAQEIAAIPATSAQGLLSSGNYTRFQHDGPGFPWGAVGNSNNELTSVITSLLDGVAYDPLMLATRQLALPMTALRDIAETGPSDDILGHSKDNKDPRGAFEWTPLQELAVSPAQQSVWAANATSQTTIITQPTHGGRVVRAELAQRMVNLRSQWFIKRNMRWTSQATSAAYTQREVHGGAAWTALCNITDSNGKAVVLYQNSVFGGITRNAYGATQKHGRSEVRINATAGLPCPAFHADTPAAQGARDIAAQYFDELSQLTLEPFAYCFRDANRHRIDDVVAEMLGLDPQDSVIQEMLAYYRLLFAQEPNVNGRQKSILAALDEHQKVKG